MRQLYKCIKRLIKNVDRQEKVVDELSLYIKVEGVFGMDSALGKGKLKHRVSYLNFVYLIYYIIF